MFSATAAIIQIIIHPGLSCSLAKEIIRRKLTKVSEFSLLWVNVLAGFVLCENAIARLVVDFSWDYESNGVILSVTHSGW